MNVKKTLALMLLTLSTLFGVETKNIDSGFASVKLYNNTANLLNFPFVVKSAKVISQVPENFETKAEGSVIVVMPSTDYKTEKADLLVTSRDDYTFVIELQTGSSERIFNFTSSKTAKASPEQQTFESGKIDNDMKKLLQSVILEKKIPGYKMMEVKRFFHTEDLLMQKEYILDGGKYRVEKWFLQNKSNYDTVVLDEGNFYTNGILAIAFETPKIEPNSITTMWLVINKSSFIDKE